MQVRTNGFDWDLLPPNRTPSKRVRRGKLKRARNEYQRENVLTVLDCYLPSQRALTEYEKARIKCNDRRVN